MPNQHSDAWFEDYFRMWKRADERVSLWREQGLTWRDMEKLTGVSNTTLLRGHRGDHMWKPSTISKILKAIHQPKLL